MKKKGIKIIFNGAGASQYTKEEVQKFRKFLKEIQPYCFISRDKKSYDFYHDLAEHSFDGIDCAFFINDYFKSANLDIEPYDVYTFDAISEPNIQGDNLNIIRSHHSPGIIPKRSYLNTKKTLISDQPFDYLNLYANAEEVHSDRVHACIVTLAFGNKCQLYSNTLRAHLFEKLGIKISDIRMNPVSLDLKKLKLLKKKQIEFLAKVLNK